MTLTTSQLKHFLQNKNKKDNDKKNLWIISLKKVETQATTLILPIYPLKYCTPSKKTKTQDVILTEKYEGLKIL